jgi:hypothetical protein
MTRLEAARGTRIITTRMRRWSLFGGVDTQALMSPEFKPLLSDARK